MLDACVMPGISSAPATGLVLFAQCCAGLLQLRPVRDGKESPAGLRGKVASSRLLLKKRTNARASAVSQGAASLSCDAV
ncbi:hypothetical protein [Bradyrhizobium liaoningense]